MGSIWKSCLIIMICGLVLACNFPLFSKNVTVPVQEVATQASAVQTTIPQIVPSVIPLLTNIPIPTLNTTNTALPQVSDTAGINWDKPRYADNFVDIYSGWPVDKSGDMAYGYPDAFGQCVNEDGSPCEDDPAMHLYQMRFTGYSEPPIFISVLPGYEYGTVGVQIDTLVANNTLGHAYYGVVCHYKDLGNYNALVVSTKGHTGIYKMENGKASYLKEYALDTGFLTLFLVAQQANQYITLRAACINDSLSLSANGTVVAEAKGGIESAGLNGLIAGVDKEKEQGDFTIYYDNYKVFEP